MPQTPSVKWLLLLTGIVGVVLEMGCAHAPSPAPSPEPHRANRDLPRETQYFDLQADGWWQLDGEGNGRFDASGLLADAGAETLFTINDRNSDLFQIEFAGSTARLAATDLFPPELVQRVAPVARPRYDCEGIARDEQGRLYICEEADRAVYRWDPRRRKVERLEIDWSRVSGEFQGGINASFEGIAVGGGKLYLANERNNPLIIVVDLATLQVIDDFVVNPTGFALAGPHYSGLDWSEGSLFVLDRNHRAVVKVNPETHRIVAEYRFGAMEKAAEVEYLTDYPTGTMEGVAVTAEHIWLITDNNGRGRVKYPNDARPTLFRCPRPDRR